MPRPWTSASSWVRAATTSTSFKMAAVAVSLTKLKHEQRPAHHANDSQTLFKNPWPSFDTDRNESLPAFAWNTWKDWEKHPLPKEHELLNVIKPDWGRDSTSVPGEAEYARDIKATWLGHACFLVEFPSDDPSRRGYRVLFDPVFSHRCSPSQWVGPARFTPPPIPMTELPEVDAVVLSHNHYDHTDTATLKHVYSAQPKGSVHFFVSLGVKQYMESISIASAHISECDWWDHAVLSNPALSASASASAGSERGNSVTTTRLRVTCTPCQHFSGRRGYDRNHSLWASWAVEQITGGGEGESQVLAKVWFGGDTAYRSVGRGVPLEEEEKLPHCPAFKEIGERFNGFDLAMIPIGAYSPRYVMSRVHASPEDSVEIHLDVRARQSVGMHWLTWQLTDERFDEPMRRLEKAVRRKVEQGHMKRGDEFVALDKIGRTLRVLPAPARASVLDGRKEGQ